MTYVRKNLILPGLTGRIASSNMDLVASRAYVNVQASSVKDVQHIVDGAGVIVDTVAAADRYYPYHFNLVL